MTNKFKLTILFLLALTQAWAQSPNMINYQGVAHNSSGAPIANQLISLRIKVHSGAINGIVQYSEERTATTDEGGLFGFQIGGIGATNIIGSFNNITWNGDTKFLQVEMDPAGGTNYTDMGTQQIVSVPYALNSKSSSSLTPDAVVNLSNLNTAGAVSNQVLQFNGTQWAPTTISTTPFSLPYSSTNANGTSFAITNSATNSTAIKGTANAANSYGVYGFSLAGKAVMGYSNNTGSVAVEGNSLAGTGVKAISYSGTALDVSGSTILDGNLKINGGNTNPSKGAILTSDSLGNAVWKKNKVGFIANYDINTYLYLSGGSFSIIPLSDSYDASNSFNNKNSVTDPNTFIAPVSGLYSFSSMVYIYGGIIYDFTYMGTALYINGISSYVHSSFGLTNVEDASVDFNQKIHLNAGDKVTLRVRHDKTVNTTSLLVAAEFSGVLVFED